MLARGSGMWIFPQIIKCAMLKWISSSQNETFFFWCRAKAQKSHVMNVCGPVYIAFNDALTKLSIGYFSVKLSLKQDKCKKCN